jgi:hypothetical protein
MNRFVQISCKSERLRAAIFPRPRLSVKGGIKALRDQFNIIDRRGDKLRCVFLLDLGAPGVA